MPMWEFQCVVGFVFLANSKFFVDISGVWCSWNCALQMLVECFMYSSSGAGWGKFVGGCSLGVNVWCFQFFVFILLS